MRVRLVVALLVACKSPPESPPSRVVPRAAIPAPVFDVPPPADPIVSIGTGSDHACVVRASGAVDCWGQPIGGPPDPAVRRMPGIHDAVSISPDGHCITVKSGDVRCLGTALAFMEDFGRPNHLGFADVVHTSSTSDRVCVTRASGDVMCAPHEQPPTRVALPPTRKLELVHSIRDQACALLMSGELRCFALSRDFQVSDVDRYDEPATLPTLTNVTDFAVARTNAWDAPLTITALSAGKVVVMRGKEVTTVPTLVDAVKIAPSCAVRAQGSVVCWGDNTSGKLGQPTTIGRRLMPPTPVVAATDVASLALASQDTWALTTTGTLLRWGSLADPWATTLALPAGVGTIKSLVATRMGSACILDERGAAWCWTTIDRAWKSIGAGIRAIGGESSTVLALGIDNSVTRTRVDHEHDDATKQPAPLPTEATTLVAGYYGMCVLAKTGVTLCGESWRPLGGANHPDRIFAQSFQGCELTASNLRCWHVSQDSESKPDTLPNLPPLVDVALGEWICGVLVGGKVQCWPFYNSDDAIDVFAGGVADVEISPDLGDHSTGDFGCAIMSDRTVQCWGANLYGELGDGSVRSSAVPVGVRNL